MLKSGTPPQPGSVALKTAIVLITSGFARPQGGSPFNTRMIFSACRIGHSSKNVGEKPAKWGVIIALGRREAGPVTQSARPQ